MSLNLIILFCNSSLAQEEFFFASVAARSLFNILRRTGRFEEALTLIEDMKAYTCHEGLGPWSQLLNEAQRLQVLNSLGRHDEVLKAVKDPRKQMTSLAEKSEKTEAVLPWNVKEVVLDTGRNAAMQLGKSELALELNADRIAVKQSRSATVLDLALARFNDYSPLIVLKRYDEAEDLLFACREVFEKERSVQGLSH
jgi:pentatricopeptide repeat protein